MLKRCNRWVLMCATLLNVSAVNAEGWYAGIAGGASSYDFSGIFGDMGELTNELDSFPGIDAAFNVEDSDTAVKIFVGHQINPNFAVEFGYVDLGETTADFSLESDGSFFPAGSTVISSTLSVDGLSAGLIGNLPLSDTASLNSRVGFYLWDAEGKFSSQDTTGVFDNSSESVSDDGNDIYYGIGLDIGWFGLFYEIYDIEGDDVDFLGISAAFELN